MPKSWCATLAKSRCLMSPCKRASGSSVSNLAHSSRPSWRYFPKMDLFSDHSASDILNNGSLLLLHPDRDALPSPITPNPPAIVAVFLRKSRLVSIIPPPLLLDSDQLFSFVYMQLYTKFY